MARLRRVSQRARRDAAAGRHERARARRLSPDQRESRRRMVGPHRLARLAAQPEHLRRRVQQRDLLDRETPVRAATRRGSSAAIARLRACARACSSKGSANLTDTVREFAQIASEDIRDGDSLYTTSLDEVARDVRTGNARGLDAARNPSRSARCTAIARGSTHTCRAFERAVLPSGSKQYDWYLRRVLLLPFDSRQVADIGRVRAGARSRLGSMGTVADEHEPAPSPEPDVRLEGRVLSVLRAQRADADLVHQLASDRHDPVVHRALPHRRGAEGARGDVSRRLHESAADVLERSPGILLRSGF